MCCLSFCKLSGLSLYETEISVYLHQLIFADYIIYETEISIYHETEMSISLYETDISVYISTNQYLQHLIKNRYAVFSKYLVYVCIYIYIYIHKYICIYIYMYIYIFVYIYIYIYISAVDISVICAYVHVMYMWDAYKPRFEVQML